MRKLYNVLIDYGTEGFKFLDNGHDTMQQAVDAAIKQCYGNPFVIVRVINWKAVEVTDHE